MQTIKDFIAKIIAYIKGLFAKKPVSVAVTPVVPVVTPSRVSVTTTVTSTPSSPPITGNQNSNLLIYGSTDKPVVADAPVVSGPAEDISKRPPFPNPWQADVPNGAVVTTPSFDAVSSVYRVNFLEGLSLGQASATLQDGTVLVNGNTYSLTGPTAAIVTIVPGNPNATSTRVALYFSKA